MNIYNMIQVVVPRHNVCNVYLYEKEMAYKGIQPFFCFELIMTLYPLELKGLIRMAHNTNFIMYSIGFLNE